MSYSLPLNITVVFSFVIFVFYLLGVHNILTSCSKNACEMTFMYRFPQFVEISLPKNLKKAYPKYALYGYGEGGNTELLRNMKFNGIPVLFIPGSSGSHKQGRSIASISLRKAINMRTPFYFDYFMVNFNQEQSAIFGAVLDDQTEFVTHCIGKILSLYENNEKKKPNSVIIIGHSLGGIIAKGIFTKKNFDPQSVRLIISLSTPHKYPLFQPDYYLIEYYKSVEKFWTNNTKLEHINLVSIGGGHRDLMVRSDMIFDHHSDVNVLTTGVPGVWLHNDHLSIMWCKQFLLTVVRAIFDSVDISTRQISSSKEYLKNVFKYHLVKRNAGKRYSPSLTIRFAIFERSPYWHENLQRQFTVREPKGLKHPRYIMLRLFSDPRTEAVFIETFNVNIKDWLYVCSADIVYNSVRMCDSGENLSNVTEIAPIHTSLNLKRKFVYLNLIDLKAKSFTHVVVRLPPLDSYMSVNIDIHKVSDRNISHQVPRLYSWSPDIIIKRTHSYAVYYSINLIGFEYIWQSYTLKLHVLSCRTAQNNGIVSLITPWANEDQHFIFGGKKTFSAPLNLISPKPKGFNASSFPYVRLNLDPTCKYKVTIEPSIIGMFAQGARYYTLLLPAFLGAVILLTVRQQMKHLDDNKCVLFHSALSSAVRRYYVILQATIFGSKILGLGLCLTILPAPDFLILQDLNLDSFFLTLLLYAVAIIVIYSMGTFCFLSVVMGGNAAHKMAIRFVAKAISGIFKWSEWVISAFHQVPIFVTTILMSLAVSTSGAIALWLGAIFYFLKLCKMYEEYCEDLFNYSLKLMARKLKDILSSTSEPQVREKSGKDEIKKQMQESKENDKEKTQEKKAAEQKEDKNEIINSEENNERGKEDTKDDSDLCIIDEKDKNKDKNQDEKEISLLSTIHFHMTMFLLWTFTAILYIPCVLIWARNYQYNVHLEKDPSLIPSFIVCLCGAVLWQPGVPRSCKKLSQITSSSLFLLAVVSIIYCTISLYRLGYVLSTGLVVVSVHQIVSKFF